MSESKGRFIIIEGADGAGTTTQAQLLFHTLFHDYPWTHPVLTSEPSAHPIGHFIRELLKGKAADLSPKEMALLFFADRGDHYRSTIIPALESGKWVICDRNWQSTLVYQALIYSNTELVNFVLQLHRDLALPKADKCLILDAPFEVMSSRRKNRKDIEVYETDRIQQKVALAYRKVVEYDSTASIVRCEQRSAVEVYELLFSYLSPLLDLN